MGLVLLPGLVAITVVAPAMHAQTFTVIHSFRGSDGGGPDGLLLDPAGDICGVADYGGSNSDACQPYGCGTAFELKRTHSGWVFNLLYTFQGGYDGLRPDSAPVFGPDGALYGPLADGGEGNCDQNTCGMVYRLSPLASSCKSALCSWSENVLYRFTGGGDGGYPGQIVFHDGDIYGTTTLGGRHGGCSTGFCGTIFEMTPSGGGWTESAVYQFAGGPGDGGWPSNLVFDHAGNIYGTTETGGEQYEGTVYELSPNGSGYTEQILYQFTAGDSGEGPTGLILDSAGNLYGTTYTGGAGGCGTVWELSPSGGSWNFSVVYSFSGGGGCFGPSDGLVMDAVGNIYGTTNRTGSDNRGVVFKLTPSGSGWTYTDLHDFTGGSDGQDAGALVLDDKGNIYGASGSGGLGSCGGNGCGSVWEITP